MKNVEYLGDGLYASFDGYQICLMANSHSAPTDVVYLDPQVYSNLQKFVSGFSAQQPVAVDAAEAACKCDTGYPIATHPICGICGLPRH